MVFIMKLASQNTAQQQSHKFKIKKYFIDENGKRKKTKTTNPLIQWEAFAI